MTTTFELITRSPEETQALGRELGKLVQSGDLILLVGDLGAGKTCFTQGIAWGIGFEGYASSPSFVLVREYRGRLNLYHADLYRLDNVEEIADLGLDDYLDGPGILVVEWANKALDSFPPEHLRIHFEHMTENERRLRFEPHGPRYQRLVEQLMTGISTDCHSRESGNPLPSPLDSCLRRNDTEGKNWNFR